MKILLAGESWITFQIHSKGFDNFFNSNYEEGAGSLIAGLKMQGIDVEYLPNHSAGTMFPTELTQLQEYSAVILSDIGANTLLLHPDSFLRSKRTPNRLALLADYVNGGGGLCMVGGYLTFQGIEAKGCWKHTAVEDVLPVSLLETDDRVESPEGVTPLMVKTNHPVLAGIDSNWPHFLGYNRLIARGSADVIATIGKNDVFMAGRDVGSGRTFVFASDCAPHWGPPEFINWKSYAPLWSNIVRWLAREI